MSKKLCSTVKGKPELDLELAVWQAPIVPIGVWGKAQGTIAFEWGPDKFQDPLICRERKLRPDWGAQENVLSRGNWMSKVPVRSLGSSRA
jgi:hypothetical protein